MEIKTCSSCKKEFMPSSRHKNCPGCRKHNYNLCKCGKRKTRTAKFCLVCAIPQTGEYNPNWRGGRYIRPNGYVYTRCPEHPRAQNNNGYVLEHILVIEESINRYLIPGETVHHKNGIKTDNRIENLELWCKPQPSGIRARDAYEQALRIVELYEPLFSTPTNMED